MSLHQRLHSFTLLLLLSGRLAATGGEIQASPVLAVMKAELRRSLDALKDQPEPPYFLSYEITERQTISVSSSFGVLTSSGEDLRRQLDIDLRVGDYILDNTHAIRGERGSRQESGFNFIEIPTEDEPEAIRAVLWYETDGAYKQAVETLARVRSNVQVKVEEEGSADFSREAAHKHHEAPQQLQVDRAAWQARIQSYTRPFARHGDIYQANARLSADRESRWYVNSEGAELQVSRAHYRLSLSAFTKADDGMELPRYESFAAFSPDGLPSDELVLARVQQMIHDLQALRRAPIVDPYTGPAILSGRASGVFFHEVFGHRIEGHRQKLEHEGQTFKKMIDRPVLPETFSVYFDPTQRDFASSDLIGAYRYDNEGVEARRVEVVAGGIFRSFLLSRSPLEGFPRSNGHGRRQAGFRPVARQSNLIVEVSNPVSRVELKQLLLERVRRGGKPFALYFEDIQGGFTVTGRSTPNAFNVLPIMVYKIFPDGREELVRGVDLIGTPLTAFSKIVAGDDQLEVFNGTCGAESGGVPVAAVSPGILVEQIEVQKKVKSQERTPILGPPFSTGRSGSAEE